jgi:hypothetical protein
MGDPLEKGASPTSERRLILLGRIVPAQATATLPIINEKTYTVFCK